MPNRTTTILTVVCILSVIFSGVNTALIINNQNTQQKVNEENKAAMSGV